MVVAAALLVAVAGSPATAGDADVRVNQEPQAVRQHYDQVLAADPSAPNRLFVADANRFDSTCFVHTSSDTGSTWRTRVLALPEGTSGCSGPSAAFAGDGTLYLTHTALVGERRKLFMARSSDGGESFDLHRDLGVDAVFSTAVGIDVSGGARNGTVYVAYIPASRPPNRRATVITSVDGGASFSPPVTLAPATEQVTGRVQLEVGPAGDVFVAYLDFTESFAPIAAIVFSGLPDHPDTTTMSAHVARSTDGGRTFADVEVDAGLGGGIIANVQTVVPFPAVAVDPGRPERAYLVVSDRRRGGDWDVYVYRSTDGGRTWSAARRLNDDPLSPRSDQVMPWLDVAPDGRVEVAWLDRRDDPENRWGRPYRSWSVDGGDSWSPNEPITDTMFDTSVGSPGQSPTSYLGDRLSVHATDAASYVVWPDTRNGDHDNGTHDLYGRSLERARVAAASADAGPSGPAASPAASPDGRPTGTLPATGGSTPVPATLALGLAAAALASLVSRSRPHDQRETL